MTLADPNARCSECGQLWFQGHAIGCSRPEAYPSGLYDGRPPAEPLDLAGTSRAAADSALANSSAMRSKVLGAIRTAGAGMTDDEVERALGLRHQTASARRRELVLLGLVRDSGRRRRTSSGRMAAVWEVV